MADRGPGQGRSAARSRRLLPADGRRCRAGIRGRSARCLAGAGILAGRRPDHSALAAVAGPGPLDQRGRADLGLAAGLDGGCAVAASGRAPDLAVLRDLRHGRRSHAAAGQFPGRPGSGAGPPDFADQSRPLPADRRYRPRFRLDRCRRSGRPAGGDLGIDAGARTLPRPFLQLVRHARRCCTGTEIYLVGR